MTEQEEFTSFFKIKPERRQAQRTVENMEIKIMRKNTKAVVATKVVTIKKQPVAKVKSEKIKVEDGFEILTNIPMPEEGTRRGVKSPFRKTLEVMKIGQCFDAETKSVPKHYHGLVGKLGIKIMIKDLDNGKKRIWRKS